MLQVTSSITEINIYICNTLPIIMETTRQRNRHTKRGHNFCAKCKVRINIGDPKTIKAGGLFVCKGCEKNVRNL